jgi:predicted N-formylglutamate amidohydrolase
LITVFYDENGHRRRDRLLTMVQGGETIHCAAPSSSILAPDEPAPFEVYNRTGAAAVLLVCDHASRFIPRALCGLGLGEEELCRHIAWDIGIADVTKGLAVLLDAPAVLSQFSRLIIDPNRPHDDELLVPQVSDGVAVPGNSDITPLAQAARIAEFHAPYHAAVEDVLAALLQQPQLHADLLPALISMHSFTPVMDGFKRPWDTGILWDRDDRLPLPLMESFRQRGIAVGDNEPYSGRDAHGYTLRRHAQPRNLPNVLVEVRQDLIDTPKGVAKWVKVLGESMAPVLAGLGLMHRSANA